ncbi:MAG: Na+:solute symporter [Candidatus Hydrogenedentes bacterium]|nr:Na+:solute symporter [Candidatus Hydrogenedentota bacterium]
MKLDLLDWTVITASLMFSLLVGIYYTKRASRSLREFFTAEGSLPWWLVGTSMVATTFAADTPLVVSGLVRKGGIFENWLWWSALMGGMLTVYFFAGLWRRAELLTDVEFVELRYEGKSAAVLRAFGAVYYGVLVNCIVMGWVTLAMSKILYVMMGWDKVFSVAILVVLTLSYTMLSGYWGVVVTDFFQFALAMLGAIALMVIVLVHLGGPVAMVEQVLDAPGVDPKVLHFVPDFRTATDLAITTFVVQMALLWWATGQGSGYLAQRLFSARDERHAAKAFLWFNIAHYMLRPWPWIVVGLASLVYFPLQTGEDHELAYPKMIAELMPSGLRGLMVASLFAAFMSTLSTQLNWGASYMVSDLYKRFFVRNASERHYVNVSRLLMLILMLIGALAAWQSDNVAKVWIYLMTIGAGGAFVGLLRWYWWRVNAWAEIGAMVSSLIVANGNLLCRLLAAVGLVNPGTMERIEWFYASDTYAIRFVFITAVCTVFWVLVMYVTPPVSSGHLERFYLRVRPGGWWGSVAQRHPEIRAASALRGWLGWFAGTVCVYTGLFGVGYLCIGRYGSAVPLLVLCAVSGKFMIDNMPREDTVPEQPLVLPETSQTSAHE